MYHVMRASAPSLLLRNAPVRIVQHEITVGARAVTTLAIISPYMEE